MQFGLPGAADGAREVAAANHPNIRLFTVTPHSAYAPAAVPRGATHGDRYADMSAVNR